MADLTWDRLEQPMLERIAQAERDDTLDTTLGYGAMAEAFGFTEREVMLSLFALIDARPAYVNAMSDDGGMSGNRFVQILGLTERGRRAVGQWPSGDPFTNLLQLLDQRIDDVTDPGERSRLTKVRDSLLGMSRDVATSLFTAWAQQRLGI
jgi:hypothetical protein